MELLIAIVLTIGILSAQQPATPLSVEQSHALALKVNDAQGRFVALHDEFFSLIKNMTTLVDFPSLAERLAMLGKNFQRLEPDVKRAVASKDPKVSRLGRALGAHLTRLRETAGKLQAIAVQLGKKAKDPTYYDFEEYKQDVTAYEATHAGIGQTGKELNLAFKSLIQ